MNSSIQIMFPVGRLVQGSIYKQREKDAEGRPLVIRTGTRQNESRVEFYFAVAIPKKNETHWSQTPWGEEIYKFGHNLFPQAAKNPNFSWKIIDGDSTIVNPSPFNKDGRRPCDIEGFKNCWVVKFKNGFASSVVNNDGSKYILEPNYINLGDYIQVVAKIIGNNSNQQPGLYLNHRLVSFQAYGERIITEIDPKTIGFGKENLPAGASLTPITSSPAFLPPTQITPALLQSSNAPPLPVQNIQPYPQILDVPSDLPPPPQQTKSRIMTEKAKGHSYEQYVASGWTDELLIQHGLMLN